MRQARIVPVALLLLLAVAVAAQGGVPAWPRVGLGLGAAGLAAFALSDRRFGGATRSALLAALSWCGLALAQLLWSASPDRAMDAAASVLTAGVVFLLAASLGPVARRRGTVAVAVLGAAVGAIACLGPVAGARASFPFGNPNHLGGWLLLPAAVAFAGAFFAQMPWKSRRAEVIWFGLLLVIGAGLAASGSRGAACAAVAMGIAVAALARLRRGVVVVALGLAIGAVGLAVTPAVLPDLVPAARDAGESSAGIRWQVYAGAAHSAIDAAPIGVGLGGFESAFAAHRPADLRYAPRFAHSEFLHAAVELGAAFLFVATLTLWLAVRSARRARRGSRSIAAWGGGAAVLALAAHALVDFPLHVPAIALTGATLAGFAWGPSRDATALPGSEAALAIPTRAALAGLSLLLAGLCGTQAFALRAERQADALLAAGDFRGAEAVARTGLAARPERAELLRLVAEAAEYEYTLAAGGDAALARALDARRDAAAADRNRADLQLDLARSRTRSRDMSGALAAADRAVVLDPGAPDVHLARARVLLSFAREHEAALAARDALTLHPFAARDVVDALLRATDDPLLAQIAVPERADAMFGAGLALRGAGYPAIAVEQFERALELEPTDTRVALEAAWTLRATGRPDRAAAILTATLERVPNHPRLATELRRLEVGRSAGGRGPS